tara:strand:- start:2300 stop:3250 length:951 start_codon:yes stop_codon:yes gene_type:complete
MKINSRKSFICGLKGLKLSKKEINFLRKYKPWGIILFSRNIKNIKQVQILTSKIKKIFKDQNYPILIDEEGGNVSRLNKIIDTSIFSAKSFGDLFKKDKRKFEVFFKVYVDQISYLLRNIGINLNTVPVLDVTHPKTSKVIGTRSYSTNPSTVSAIGDTCINYFHNQRIGTIIKHIPGHGLAQKDSHKIKPIVKSGLKSLKNDFNVFKNKKSIFAMTAHIVYKNIDPLNTVTHSKKLIKLIRNTIKFKNIIISDDLSMAALSYSIEKNTQKAFSAGCNLVLHCNGNMQEMLKVAKNSPKVNSFIIKKTLIFNNIIS